MDRLKNGRLACAIIALILGIAGMGTAAGAAGDEDKILVINSYSYDWDSVPGIIGGIKEELGNSVDADYIFMDAKNLGEQAAAEMMLAEIQNYMADDGAHVDYDLVIISDDPALDFVLEHRAEFFEGLPVVFMGINSPEKANEAAKDPLITGIAEQFPMKETIELATGLYPEAKRIVALSNETSTGKGSEEQFYNCRDEFSGLEFVLVNTEDYTESQINEKVAALDTDTILICLMYDRTGDGNVFPMEQGVYRLYNVAKIPIFRMDELAIDNGALGGCVISYYDMGRAGAEMALDILGGKPAVEIPVKVMPSFYELNWQTMQKFGISKSDIDVADVRYLNYEPDCWEKNCKWITAVLTGALIAAIIITALVHMNRKKRMLNERLTESSNSLRAAVDIAQISYYEYFPKTHSAAIFGTGGSAGSRQEYFNVPDVFIEMNAIHKDDIQKFRDTVKQMDSGRADMQVELRHRVSIDGEFRWFKYSMRAINGGQGRLTKIVCIGRDITLEKRAEEDYRRHMNAIIAADKDNIAAFRMNLTRNSVREVHAANYADVLSADHSTQVDEFIARAAGLLICPDDCEKFLATFNRAKLLEEFERGNTSLIMKSRRNVRGGEMQWIGTTVELYKESHRGNVEAIVYVCDETYKHMMELLLENAARHDYDYLSFVYGNTQRFISYSRYNDAPLEPGENYSGVLCRDVDNICTDDADGLKRELSWDNVTAQLQKSGEYTIYYTVYTPDGGRRRKRLQFFYIDPVEKLVLGSQSDMTDIFESEARQSSALEKALEDANAANTAKTDFFSRMSHDIRTPMNAIIGITALALDECDNEAAVRENLTKINSAGHFLLGLLNDILDMSKIEEGSIELHPEPYYYEDFLGNMRTMFEPMCNENGIKFELMEANEKLCVMADKVRLNQIFFNLLSNAVKFTPEGGKVSYSTANFNTGADFVECDYTISDTGVGMSEEFQKKMFQPFSQENNGITSHIQGTGLGLSITRSLVELMGGTIAVRSKPGEGTSITIHLRFTLANDHGSSERFTRPEGESSVSLEGRRILLVEDHPLNTEIARKLLEKRGMNVYCAENGRIAVEKFSGSKLNFFDAVLMDIRMPVMDGLDAARKIRALDRPDAQTVPIIAMTANAYQEDVRKSLEAGMNAHLAKPIEPAILYDTLRNMLDKK